MTLVDVSSDVLAKAQKSIGNNLNRVAKKVYKDKPQEGEKFVSESMARIKTATDAASAAASADLVVEAIVENIAIKHQLFQKLDEVIILICCHQYLAFVPGVKVFILVSKNWVKKLTMECGKSEL